MATFTAREFNQDVSAAKRAADRGPVVITDRGGPAYVLLSISDYNGMVDKRSIVDRLEMDDDFDFAPEPMQVEFRFPSCDLPARHQRGERAPQAARQGR